MSVFDILIHYYPAFLKGLAVTLQLSAIVWLSGLVLGGALGMAGARFWPAGLVSRIFSFILGGVPLLVFLFWLHYPAQAMFNVVIDPFYTAAFTFSIVNIFAVADIVRGALADFPQQYLIAAKVTGLTRGQTIFRIQFPLILRSTLPTLLRALAFLDYPDAGTVAVDGRAYKLSTAEKRADRRAVAAYNGGFSVALFVAAPDFTGKHHVAGPELQ